MKAARGAPVEMLDADGIVKISEQVVGAGGRSWQLRDCRARFAAFFTGSGRCAALLSLRVKRAETAALDVSGQ